MDGDYCGDHFAVSTCITAFVVHLKLTHCYRSAVPQFVKKEIIIHFLGLSV